MNPHPAFLPQNEDKKRQRNLRLLPLPSTLLALDPLQRLLDQPNMAPQRSFKFIHSCFVFLQVVVVVRFEVECHAAQGGESEEL